MRYEAEIWEATFVSSEDSLRAPQFLQVFAGKDLDHCIEKMQGYENNICKMWMEDGRYFDDGGLPMLYSIRYVGIFDIRSAQDDGDTAVGVGDG